jgi:hypothetical protein
MKGINLHKTSTMGMLDMVCGGVKPTKEDAALGKTIERDIHVPVLRLLEVMNGDQNMTSPDVRVLVVRQIAIPIEMWRTLEGQIPGDYVAVHIVLHCVTPINGGGT